MPSKWLRYPAAMILLLYGFAKINGSQFTILDSELDKPMGQVSGFWLTWRYFGYSWFYGNFIALVQVAGAVMLTFRRTAVLAACVLLPMLVNIALIDLFYGVEPSAMLVAVGLAVVMAVIIAPKAKAILEVVAPVVEQPGLMWKNAIRGVMVVLACGVTYWLANYNNRNPTPIDGVWDVLAAEPAGSATLPARVFFEYNRAGMVVFKSKDGVYETHDFAVDRERGRLQMWERWLSRDKQIFDGTFSQSGSELRLSGTLRGVGTVTMQLAKHAVQ